MYSYIDGSSSLVVKHLLKGTQAWDNFDFFLPISNSYMPFRKKFSFSFDFRQNFEVWTFSRWLSIRRTNFGEISQKNFSRCSLVSFAEHTLSIRGNDLIAHWACAERIFAYAQPAVKCSKFLHVHLCWAYGEMILSHPEHTKKWCKHWLSIRVNDFIADWAYVEMFKSRISQPNRIRFSKIFCYRPLGP